MRRVDKNKIAGCIRKVGKKYPINLTGIIVVQAKQKKMKQYPIGIQSFEKLRNGGYHYIDKTKLVYRLATTGNYYFLSRPRRFGKSLLLSTLHAYFGAV